MSTQENNPLDNQEKDSHPSLLSKISGLIHDLNAEFPLSGGETEGEWEKGKHFLKEEAEHIKEEIADLPKDVKHSFPLSGGE